MSTTSPKGSAPLSTKPPEAWGTLVRLARVASRPLERFLQIEAASGILLLVVAAIAMAWANSPWAESYTHLWHTPVSLGIGTLRFERSLEWVVNDGLMAIFFFVVGMEIRREIHHGELSEWRRATLPLAAAIGGMLAPALLFFIIAGGTAGRAGWGVPMATDIAFAVGVLTLLGKRVPPALRVLLLALAVIDDLGAIVVIAIFYSAGIEWSGLLVAAAAFACIFAMQRFGVRTKWLYVLPGIGVWAGIAASGIHPTIAGVLIGLATPVTAWLGTQGFLIGVRQELEHISSAATGTLSSHELAASLRHVDAARREAMSPAESLIETLHPWVAYGIMPLFALANAGVTLAGSPPDTTSWSVISAVCVGLVAGKPLGILLAIGLALKLRLASLPTGISFRHLLVLGVVGGVGFTMALFIAQLAFTDASLLSAAKVGVLLASLIAGCVALLLGRILLGVDAPAGAAATADEAESSTTA